MTLKMKAIHNSNLSLNKKMTLSFKVKQQIYKLSTITIGLIDPEKSPVNNFT